MSAYRIPFNKPFIVGREMEYMARAVESGQISGDGEFTRKCHAFLEGRFRARKVLLTTSGSAALEMAAILFGVGAGDEVIMPSFTFVSTANAFYGRGARPVFVDIRPDTLNLDERLIEEAVTDRTRAVVPVHYAGVACEMDAVTAVTRKHGLRVVEDAAQGLDALYGERYLGTMGDLGAWSFHETKNVICGEGGALVVNDEALMGRAEVVREKGTNRSRFFRGEVDRYTWVDVGSSYLPSDLLAAFLYAQLEHLEEIGRRRERIYTTYLEALGPLEERGILRLPVVPEGCRHNSHMFHILLEDEGTRDALMRHLRERGVLAVFHYLPLHLSAVGRGLGYGEGMLPVTESVSGRLLRLPFYFGLTEAEQAEVAGLVEEFFAGGGGG